MEEAQEENRRVVTAFDALFLGLLQGMTELLPVSSSGHLVLAELWLGLTVPEELASFDILLHVGSLLALLACYPFVWWRMLRAPFVGDHENMHLLLTLAAATVPGAVTGLFFEDLFTQTMRTPVYLGLGFLFTALALIIADGFPERSSGAVRWSHAILIGIAQAVALPPSVSRSGMTITAARLLGWSKAMAVDFSFLLAVPIIGGATLVTATRLLGGAPLPSPPAVAVGVCASFGASVFAILFLRVIVQKIGLKWFALYLIPLGVFLLAR